MSDLTCIVAIEHNGSVYMGSDKAGSSTWSTGIVEPPKTFQNGPLLIGYTTSFRMGQLLEHALEVPEDTLDWNVDRWVSVDLMKAVRQAFNDNGWDGVTENKAYGGCWLLAVRGRAYAIQSNYSFIRSVPGEYATGSGEDFALGSLHSTRGQDPHTRVIKALEAAAERSPSVSGPFDVRVQHGPRAR